MLPYGRDHSGEACNSCAACWVLLGKPRYVDPRRWKADLYVPADKQLAKARAWALFPGCEMILASEGKAEAALIALYGALSAGVPPAGIRPATRF